MATSQGIVLLYKTAHCKFFSISFFYVSRFSFCFFFCFCSQFPNEKKKQKKKFFAIVVFLSFSTKNFSFSFIFSGHKKNVKETKMTTKTRYYIIEERIIEPPPVVLIPALPRYSDYSTFRTPKEPEVIFQPLLPIPISVFILLMAIAVMIMESVICFAPLNPATWISGNLYQQSAPYPDTRCDNSIASSFYNVTPIFPISLYYSTYGIFNDTNYFISWSEVATQYPLMNNQVYLFQFIQIFQSICLLMSLFQIAFIVVAWKTKIPKPTNAGRISSFLNMWIFANIAYTLLSFLTCILLFALPKSFSEDLGTLHCDSRCLTLDSVSCFPKRMITANTADGWVLMWICACLNLVQCSILAICKFNK